MNLYFKKYFFIIQLFIFSLDVFALNKQFPADNYDYKPVQDIGIRQYEATSLHGTKKIVLTFDDGPNTHVTPKILDLLNKYNVKATFFINTSNLDSKKIPIAYRILEEGHILASHDFDHRDNNKENENVFREGLLRSIFDIKKLERNLGLVKKGIYFRFPYGYYGLNAAYHHMNVIKEVSKKVYDENCINFVFWDIDTKDWGPGMTSLEISQNVKSYMMGGKATTVFMENNRWVKKIINIQKPLMGGVVLLHDKREETYYATESILKMANDLNWDVVPLSSVKEFSFDKKECLIKKDMSLSSLGN